MEIIEHAFVIEGDGFNYTLAVLILPKRDGEDGDDEDLLTPLSGTPSFR